MISLVFFMVNVWLIVRWKLCWLVCLCFGNWSRCLCRVLIFWFLVVVVINSFVLVKLYFCSIFFIWCLILLICVLFMWLVLVSVIVSIGLLVSCKIVRCLWVCVIILLLYVIINSVWLILLMFVSMLERNFLWLGMSIKLGMWLFGCG